MKERVFEDVGELIGVVESNIEGDIHQFTMCASSPIPSPSQASSTSFVRWRCSSALYCFTPSDAISCKMGENIRDCVLPVLIPEGLSKGLHLFWPNLEHWQTSRIM
jgi:hypothetical protein